MKKRWQEHTEELYKQGFNYRDNHDGVITYLKPDILECDVCLGSIESIITNKASGGDKIPAELFKTLMLLKCCIQYVSKFGKHSSGHRTRKV